MIVESPGFRQGGWGQLLGTVGCVLGFFFGVMRGSVERRELKAGLQISFLDREIHLLIRGDGGHLGLLRGHGVGGAGRPHHDLLLG